MKRALMMVVLLVMGAAVVKSQVHERVVEVTNTRFAPTAGTTGGYVYRYADSAEIDLKYTNTKLGLIDAYPDSVAFSWATKGTTTADSVGVVFSILLANNNGAFLGRAVQDSVFVQENDSKLIARTTYQHKDKIRAVAMTNKKATGAADKTQYITNGGAAVFFRVKLWYRIP